MIPMAKILTSLIDPHPPSHLRAPIPTMLAPKTSVVAQTPKKAPLVDSSMDFSMPILVEILKMEVTQMLDLLLGQCQVLVGFREWVRRVCSRRQLWIQCNFCCTIRCFNICRGNFSLNIPCFR